MAALIFGLGLLVLLPPFNKITREHLNFELSRNIKICSVIMLYLVGCIAYSSPALLVKILVLVGIGALILLFYGYLTRCPKCKALFSVDVTKKDLIDTWDTWSERTRREETGHTYQQRYDEFTKGYKEVKVPIYSDVRYRVQTTQYLYRVERTCSKCGHAWQEDEETSTDTWHRT